MLRILSFLSFLVLSAVANDLGSVAGIKFGDDISRFEKIQDIECGNESETKLKFCVLQNQKIINDTRIANIVLYFNTENKLYRIIFYGPEVKHSNLSSLGDNKFEAQLDKSDKFLRELYIENKSLVSLTTKRRLQKTRGNYFDTYYEPYVIYINTKMFEKVELYTKILKMGKAKKIKANY